MRNRAKSVYHSSSYLNPSKLLICILILVQILEMFPMKFGVEGAILSSPDMYQYRLSTQRGHNFKGKRMSEFGDFGTSGTEKIEFHKSSDNSELEDNSYGEHQLLPTGLIPQPYPKSSNQANGWLMEKDPFEELETSGRLGLFNVYNDYDLPSKHVAARSRHIGDGLTVKRSQNPSLSAREGYMCHFKLCQFGASGKRRWSPLFEFD